jgi:alpha-L-fucosidase 2
MKRRDFIKKSSLLGGLMFLGPRVLSAASDSSTDAVAEASAPPLALWYDKPAAFRRTSWANANYRTLLFEAMLIGNGRLGAMIRGGIQKEMLRLNEHTLCSGGPNPTGYINANFGSYQALGDLIVNLNSQGPVSQYRRSLNIENAVSDVTYTSRGVEYRREYFVSHPDEVIVVRFSASRPGSYSGSLNFEDAHSLLSKFNKNLITIAGSLENGLQFETQILILNEGGSQQVSGEPLEESIEFDRCDSLTILINARTDYVLDAGKYYRGKEKVHDRVSQELQAAATQSFEQLKARHIADYQSLFNSFAINLGKSTEAQRALPTDLRRVQARKETDPEFEQMACQYGRYLMISCSRLGGVPANGQGLWNDNSMMVFRSLYTNDIAPTELSYFGVEPSNLAECHVPLLNFIQGQLPDWRKETLAANDLKLASGALTTRGWEIRGSQNPMGGQNGWWNKGGNAWYCSLFWEHYAFSNDRDFLEKTVYPLLKEICEYWEDHLSALPDGRLIVTKMKYSPEHGPFDVDGCSYCQELVWDLFTNYIEACDILGIDKSYQTKIAGLKEKLLVPGIGSWGQLLEWMTDMKGHISTEPHEIDIDAFDNGPIDTPQNKHRHQSHLLGVFPFKQISYEQTPELAAAAKVSAIARGNGDAGKMVHLPCSFGHRIPIYARLYDGDHAYDLLQRAWARIEGNNLAYDGGEVSMCLTLPTGFCEMLVQSHQKDIHVLPALPKAWPTGSVKGIRARGGYEVDESWKDGELSSLTIRSIAGKDVKVRYRNKTVVMNLSPGKSVQLDRNLEPV